MSRKHVGSVSTLYIDSGPIGDMCYPPIGSSMLLLQCLCVSLHMQIIFSKHTYRSIAYSHDRVQVVTIVFVLIMFQLTRFPLWNIEVHYTQHTNPFMLLQETIVAPS